MLIQDWHPQPAGCASAELKQYMCRLPSYRRSNALQRPALMAVLCAQPPAPQEALPGAGPLQAQVAVLRQAPPPLAILRAAAAQALPIL